MWDLIRGVNTGVKVTEDGRKKSIYIFLRKYEKKDLWKYAAVYKTPENHESPYGYYVCIISIWWKLQ